MKKKLLVISAILVFALSATACANKTDSTAASAPGTGQTQNTGQTGDGDKTENADKTEAAVKTNTTENSTPADTENGSESASEGAITGVVDVNKGFMITVISDEDSEAYVFSLDDDQSEKYKDLKAKDKVTVSYTNGLPSPDNLDTVVVDIKAAE